MLDARMQRKLESLTQLPTIPFVISEVLSAVDNTELSASHLAKLIEKDQSLALRVLKVANSPFYGFSRKISTIDLAIVIMGLNSIKEIVLSLVIQRFFAKIRGDVFDIKSFWQYSIYCGACSRVLAKKLGYRVTGEAFVAGLMHDIGILILIQFFTKKFKEIRTLQRQESYTFVDAEKKILDTTHCDIGAWLAERWNLPGKICLAIKNHHSSYAELKILQTDISTISSEVQRVESAGLSDVEEPLTLIVAMTEWFAREMGFKEWTEEETPSTLYLASEILEDMRSHDLLEPESAFEMLKREIMEEFTKASIFGEIPARA